MKTWISNKQSPNNSDYSRKTSFFIYNEVAYQIMIKENVLERLSKEPSEKPIQSWPDFANNFLFRFFEGQSLTIWFFVSGTLIVLYAKYASFANDLPLKPYLQYSSLVLLIFLITYTLAKNFIFLNPFGWVDNIRSIIKSGMTYRLNSWLAEVLGPAPKKLDLPIKIVNFKKISSRVHVINPGKGRWRAGFFLENSEGSIEYIFHAYQDEGDSTFHTRIVGRKPGILEMSDVKKTLSVKHPYNFNLLVEKENDYLIFYVDGIFSGKYKVPMETITNCNLAAWSDKDPIAVLFKEIEVLA